MTLRGNTQNVMGFDLEKEIESLRRLNKQIIDVSISYFDGTSILSTNNDETAYILSAAASALKGIADKISGMLNSGLFVKLIIHFEKEKIIVLSVDNKINILLRAKVEAPLGLLLRDITNLANKLRNLI